jgi:prepilin-type processing-associated H-X9-DG protein
MYTDDHGDLYPVHSGWANVGGGTGNNEMGNASEYGGRTPSTNRPLYRYTGQAPEVFRCPADKGDSLNTQVKTAWEGWGNSYLVEWKTEGFRIAKVTADSRIPMTDPSKWGMPARVSDFAKSPSNKLIIADWPWHANRSVQEKQSLWHNHKGRRYENVLFADGHVEYVHFPKEMDTWQSAMPNPANKWW